MEFRVTRKVSFVEEAIIEADSMEEAKELIKKATLDWEVDFEFYPEIEKVFIGDNEGYFEEEELPTDYMEEDYVGGMNGCIIFNEKDFRRHTLGWSDEDD